MRNSELVWREAKRQLRKDHRWELAELLDREEKEKLFNEHIEQLSKKKKEKFRYVNTLTWSLSVNGTNNFYVIFWIVQYNFALAKFL